MRIKLRNNKSGFTLVEVMATMSLLLMFTGGFLILLTQSYVAIKNAGHKSNTIYTNQQYIEQVYSQKSVDEPYNVVINYSNGSKTIKGGLKTVESTEGSQNSTAQTFIPLAPMIELYMLDSNSEKVPAVFQVNDYHSTSVKISCVNFSYIDDSCSIKIFDVNDTEVNFYHATTDIQNNNLLNLTFNSQPEIGTYTVFIKNFENSFEAKGVFTVNPQTIENPS